jgi:hypothetical protein
MISGSLFKGLLTRVEIGQAFIRSEGNRGFVTQVRRTLLVNGGHYIGRSGSFAWRLALRRRKYTRHHL